MSLSNVALAVVRKTEGEVVEFEDDILGRILHKVKLHPVASFESYIFVLINV